jgi:hypothetical protein
MVGGLVGYQHEVAVCFILADLLQDPKIINVCKEVPPGESCYWFGGELGGRDAELVNFWRKVWWELLSL